MTNEEIALNKAATFLPMVDEESERPCLVVAGVQVYAYFKDGVLRVSVDADTADDAVVDRDGGVPLLVAAGDAVVFEGRYA